MNVHHFRVWVGALLVLGAVGIGCGSSRPSSGSSGAPTASTAPPPADAGTSGGPETLEEARALHAKGVGWDNVHAREHYLKLVSRIKDANEGWKKEGLPAEERARRAYKMRYEARMLTRVMMADKNDVKMLEDRDQRRFGHPDGPTFDELVDKEKKKGLQGDAVYEAIVVSAQRTDPIINELVGPSHQ